MIKLADTFKIAKGFGKMVEIRRTIGDQITYCPILRREVKKDESGEVYVSETAISRCKWFFNIGRDA